MDNITDQPKRGAPPPPTSGRSRERETARGGEKIPPPLAQCVEFLQLKPPARTGAERPDPRFFRNIPLILSGELGTAEITVRELLALEEGSVVKLDKLVGESATVLVNEQYLGQAEIVVVNERFGLRITTVGRAESQEEKEEQGKGDVSAHRPAGTEPEPEPPLEE